MNRALLPLMACFFILSGDDNRSPIDVIHSLRQTADADWLIVGGGPAGISTVGVLMAIGISPSRIIWIDPVFDGGHITHYPNVPANNTMQGFIDFIVACNTFKECTAADVEELKLLQPEGNYELRYIIKVLRHMTDFLRTQVKSVVASMTALHFHHDMWHIGTSINTTITAAHVVLATGSHPKTLEYEQHKIIPLDIALNPPALASTVSANDRIAVLGSSHSAILILKFLSELAQPVEKIINLYRHPIQYAVDMGTWTMVTPHSLKGVAAEWAKNVLEKNPPKNLTRIVSTDETLKEVLPSCTKVIYALGFERNDLPAINNSQAISTYNESTGFIAPRLFGIGIAFPELWADPSGYQFHRVGLNSFMEYAQHVIPEWANDELYKLANKQHFKTQLVALRKMSELFAIYAL